MSKNILFQGRFLVNALNVNGKKFERVNRVHCKSDPSGLIELILDVNSELFPTKSNDVLSIMFADSLTNTPDDGTYNPNPGSSLADNFDYVMHGRVFLIKHLEGQKIEIQASFGGLLLRITGSQADLESFAVDMKIFILLKNIGSN